MSYQSRDYNLHLTAGVELPIDGIYGKFYRFKSASVSGVTLQVQFNDSGAWSPMSVGDWVELPQYSKIRLLCVVDVDIVLYLGAEMQRSDSAVVNIATVSANWAENNSGASPLDVPILTLTAAVISAARATKRSTIIYNPSTNVNSFRVGVGAAAGAGVLVEPGMGIEIDGSIAISAYNNGATTEALTVTETDRI